MKVLIVGGAGFIGTQLSFHLAECGHSVMVMDNLARRGSELNAGLLAKKGISFRHGDIRCLSDLAVPSSGIDVICLAAAQPSVVYGYINPLYDFNVNTQGSINVLEFARKHGCGVIYFSTNRVYDAAKINRLDRVETHTRWAWPRDSRPEVIPGFDAKHGISEEFCVDGGMHSIYGLTKLLADLACQEYAQAFGLPIIINRFGCVAGNGQFGVSEQGWVTWFALAFHYNLPLRFFGWSGKQVRDVLFVEDLCSLVEQQLDQLEGLSGQVFNIGGGAANILSPLEAVHLLSDLFGHSVPVSVEDTPRKGDCCIYVSDTRKAQRLLGWQPSIGILDGYQRIIGWIRDNTQTLDALYGG